MEDLKIRFLALAVDGKIRGKDIPDDMINRDILNLISQLKTERIIRDAFVPFPGSSYNMDYLIL